jgi:hypothetical protein
MHYLQDINFAYSSILNSHKLNSFVSIDYLYSLKNKLDIIFNNFNKKKDNAIAQFLNNEKWEPFQPFELFKESTSIEVLDLATQIVVNTILIVTKTKGYYDQYDQTNIQNISYFNSLIVISFNLE